MKQKLFTLLTLLVMCVTGAWGDEVTATLINQSTGDVNSTDFKTTLASKSGTYTCGDYGTFTKYIQMGGAVSTPIGAYQQDRVIRYDVLTNSVTVDVYAYNKANSDYKLYVSMIEEGDAEAKDIDIKEFTVTKKSGNKFSHTFTPTTNASIYIHVGNNSNVYICQAEVTDNGATTLKQGGEIGYTANLTLCRIASNKALTSMDGIEYNATSNSIKVLTSGNPVKLKATTEYIKFTLNETEKVSINASGTYSVTTENTYQSESAVSGNQNIILDAGTYYICPNGSNVTFASLSFLAPPSLYTVTYNLNGGTGTTPTESDKAEGEKFTLHNGTTGITAPTGKEFSKWKDQDANEYDGGTEFTMPGKDVKLTAQWRVPATKHSVTYNLNGGTGTAPTQEDVEEGAEFTVAGTEGISAPENKRFSTWNDGTNDYAPSATYTMGTVDVTLTALWIDVYAITKGTHANGDFTITPASAEEGETVTLTATPNFKYVLDSWSVYKTGDPTTTVTVTDNKFTMPAYAVTVDATFTADPKKQILYLTSDGNVNENDKLYAALAEDYTVTKAKYDATKTVTDFDLVVFHESIGGTNHGTGLVKAAIEADVPVLNTKSYFYNDGRWGWGTPNAGTSVAGATLNPAYGNTASHPIFDGVTISDPGFVTLFSSAEAKAMQPVTDLVSGKEGYTLAITPNASSGNGVAIHELTPAQRGVTNAKYLMVSIGNANGCFEKLTANGQKLLKNAAAYLIDNTASWTPTTIVEGTIAANKEWITFCSTANLDFSSDIAGLEGAYTITAHADKATALTATKMTGKVKAGTGLLLRAKTVSATDAQAIAIPVATTGDEQADNMLKGVTVDTEVQPTAGDYTNLGLSNGEFHPYSAAGTLAAGKAYLQVPTAQMPSGGNNARLYIVLDGEATGIANVDVNANDNFDNAPMYNLAGQKVSKSYKGIVIVNGKKVVRK
jgi:hypothetical protein